jgi:serine phosphatase RsbU (regulator of sigma subunit)
MYDGNKSIYMFSDGYLDQYGREKDEKFNTTRFKEMILANRKLPMEEQKEILSKTMDEWKDDRQQIDDFLVMGVKLSDLDSSEN